MSNKLTDKQASEFVSVLYDFVRINAAKYKLQVAQWKLLFMSYSLQTVNKAMELILDECTQPTDKFSGQLPKLGIARRFLGECAPKYQFDDYSGNINQGSCPPNVFKCVMKGLGRGDGKGTTSGVWRRIGPKDFDLKEYYIELINSHRVDNLKMCRELDQIENQYIELGAI